ncbi:hypothetical protein Pcinc_028410 [Petrolisthes cinctipes]|uniref:Uncharacterized protein n=1 Tax=Petrolisthes cinctipes TaxID=88211 RepID=A0AAE1F1X4_PETCI|nr:hypothetical protein Pcinc_028410 [Petrolisthes cinctipes]
MIGRTPDLPAEEVANLYVYFASEHQGDGGISRDEGGVDRVKQRGLQCSHFQEIQLCNLCSVSVELVVGVGTRLLAFISSLSKLQSLWQAYGAGYWMP